MPDTAKLRGREDVLRKLDKLQRDTLDSGRLLSHFGPKIRDAVVTRTSQGIDLNDANFGDYAPYSLDYSKRKKDGRRAPVTLLDDGDMFELTRFKRESQTSGKVSVNSPRDIVAEAHHRGLGRMPERKWLGMSPSDMRTLNEDTVDFFEKEIRGFSTGTFKVSGKATKGRSPWTIVNPS